MPERCELCGAKVRPEDEACRECGAPLGDGSHDSDDDPLEATDATRDITALEPTPIPDTDDDASAAVPAETSPDLRIDPPPTRRGAWVALLTVAAVASAGVFALTRGGDDVPDHADVVDAPDPAPQTPDAAPVEASSCEGLRALAGQWTFTTEVTGSRVVQSSGLNGFYTLGVEVDGCTSTASLTKTGYTGRAFSEVRVQRGSAALTLAEGPNPMATASFELTSGVGTHGTTEFSFAVHGDTLSGVYRQRGSRWDDAGLSGFLQGSKDGDAPAELTASSQSCTTRCHLACDSATRDPPDGALTSCTEACTAGPDAPVHCGDAQDLPSEYQLTLQGPGKLASLCKAVGGCAKKIGRAHPEPPRIAADRLPEGWTEVTMIRAKKEGGVRLALHSNAGWFLSDPLFDVSTGTRLGKLRLYARQLSEGKPRRYVLGLARMGGTENNEEAYVACRLDDVPTCIRVVKPRGSLVNALPEGNLSVTPEAADLSGVFRW